ncbi:PTS transporter subunit EIIB [Arcanobacterium phocae]|uniref:PTS transporter subunit EIIB n=1 Tax=Arcanobacterium phocae TaxID=131112 RepID=UPI001C0EFB76|nr:PTS transporter subunit EIIB [Arcanobacterium phocae]
MTLFADEVVLGLGGRDNVLEVTPAYTRIRVEVASLALVNEDLLRAAGAIGIVCQKGHVHLIVGNQANELAEQLSASCVSLRTDSRSLR